jgi:hypothetical protein
MREHISSSEKLTSNPTRRVFERLCIFTSVNERVGATPVVALDGHKGRPHIH